MTIARRRSCLPERPLLLLQSPFLLGRGQEVAVLLAALEARGFCLGVLAPFGEKLRICDPHHSMTQSRCLLNHAWEGLVA